MRGFESRSALFTYRRYARECAVMALHTAESSGLSIEGALRQVFELFESEDVQEEIFRERPEETEAPVSEANVRELFEQFAAKLARGVWQDKAAIDAQIAQRTPAYDYSRLAPVDRNVLRVAMWEMWNVPYVPPAVTLNEAVEIAKKYSTAESGKFVNGVLGALLRESPKASWNPQNAPPDPELPKLEEVFRTQAPQIEVEVVEEGTDEAIEAKRFGIWKLRAGDQEIPPLTEP
ncbi:MAG TPA: transcription antitermination factor NusB [Fimbriimonas sp.]